MLVNGRREIPQRARALRTGRAPLSVWAAWLAAMWGTWGCGERSSPAEDLPLITAGSANEIFEDTGALAVEFLTGTELGLRAGQTQQLRVRVLPPGRHRVRFALLGDVQSAFLSRDLVETGEDGLAQTALTVLTASSSFEVRAAAGQVEAVLQVVTQEANDARLILAPLYDEGSPNQGSREIESWFASVHVGQTCAALQGVPYPDGSRLTSSSSAEVTLDRVPADMPLAAVVRAGYFAGGCRNIAPLRANSEARFEVEIMDRPMQTLGLTLPMSFGVEATEVVNPALDELAFRAVSSMVGSASDDLAALLDVMSVLSSDPLAFEEAREAQNWRAALVSALAPELPGTGLRTLVQNWMRTGLERLEQPDAIRGSLTFLSADGLASLELESVLALPAEETGFERENAASARAEAEDLLRIGATLAWQPSPLLAAAANYAALEQNPEQASAGDAMAALFGCPEVATVLVSAGSAPDEAFAACGEACVLELCEGAMRQLWSRVAESGLPAVPWQISGAARARIDDYARPTRVSGDWIGSLTVSELGVTPIQGPFSGGSGGD